MLLPRPIVTTLRSAKVAVPLFGGLLCFLRAVYGVLVAMQESPELNKTQAQKIQICCFGLCLRISWHKDNVKGSSSLNEAVSMQVR